MLLHIGAFRLDIDSLRASPWHALTPGTRVICTLVLVFAIALTPNGQWLTWLVYGIGVGAIALLSRITWSELLKRVGVEFIFVGVVLLGTLFRPGGAVVWQWGWLRVTTEGLTVLASVTLKMVLSLVMLNILVLTTSVSNLLHGLAALRVPSLLIAILASMFRYLTVLVDEFHAMRRAAISRNLLGSRRWQRLVVGNMIGVLFIRTYERGERIHQAMLARGYTGLPPVEQGATAGRRDRSAVLLMLILALFGQLLHFTLWWFRS
jgi:cobalt/nickel transport system permease protein